MAGFLGIALGIGLAMVWSSFWPRAPKAASSRRQSRLERALLDAGILKVTPTGLIATSIACGVVVALLVFVFTRSVALALCFGLFGGGAPVSLVSMRARRRSGARHRAWPDAVDHLRSAIRAGLSMPEALAQLAVKGPEELREPFAEFALDYRSSGQLDSSLSVLKERLADPVADRIVEALRLTRDVGGTELGRLLGTLSEFLRDDARTRSELEARQSWTVNGARLAVAAPWVVLLLMAGRPEAVTAYSTGLGALVLLGGLVFSVFCYKLMLRVGTLPEEERVLA